MPCLKMLSPAPPQSSDPSLATPEMGWPLLLTPDLGIHVNMALPAMLCLRMLRAIMHPCMYIQESSKFKMKDGWVGRGKLFRVPKLPKLPKLTPSSKATSVTRPSMTLDVNIPNLWPCKRRNYISCSKRKDRNIEWKLITKRYWCLWKRVFDRI